MTTKEFVEQIKELGFVVERTNSYVAIRDNFKLTVASVRTNEVYYMDTSWGRFSNLSNDLKEKLFLLLLEYTSTQIEEREEE